MEIVFIAFAKPDDAYLNEGNLKYSQKIPHYIKFQNIIIPPLKNTKSLTFEQQKTKEGEKILSLLNSSDLVILLDEKGKTYSSIQFADFIQKQMNTGIKRMIFISGGPYGFSQDVYNRANLLFSLSLMTFTHQMVQLIFLEQLYRAMTILKGEPYHH